MLHYCKSKPNGKLLYKSILEGLYHYRQILVEGDKTHTPPIVVRVQMDQVSILAKDKGFRHEMHNSEESEAVYGITPPKDYAVSYSNEEMRHHTLYGVKLLPLYAATFKFTRDDLSESALRRNIGDKLEFNHCKLGRPARVIIGECGIAEIVFKFLVSLNISLNFENEYVALTATQLEYGGNAIDLSCKFKLLINNKYGQICLCHFIEYGCNNDGSPLISINIACD
ncbi:hypothetical protein Tco_1026815 [Tanacetum coccineum]